jgi:ornithine--oxo-acid transaminase
MAAGLATLHELDEQRLVARAAELGARLLELTRPLVERHEAVAEVRGLGLMWAVELADASPHGLLAQLVSMRLFAEHRVLSQTTGTLPPALKALPPLTVAEDDLAAFAQALDEAIARAQRLQRLMPAR